MAGETRTPDFEHINRNGKIPVLQVNESVFLWESNAILNFLAEDTPWLPDQGIERAKVLQWQFFEQYSHEPYIAVARFINKYLGLPKERKAEFHSKREGGYKALSVMENQLSQSEFLVGSQPTIADISLYAYTHVAHEGGFELDEHPRVQAWLRKLEELPGYISMSN